MPAKDFKKLFKDIIDDYPEKSGEHGLTFGEIINNKIGDEPEREEELNPNKKIDRLNDIEDITRIKYDKDNPPEPNIPSDKVKTQPNPDIVSAKMGQAIKPTLDDEGKPIEVSIPENPEDSDITLNSFSDKLNYVSIFFKEHGYSDIRALIKDGYGVLVIDSDIDDSVIEQLKQLAQELKMNITVKEEETSDGNMYTIKLKNKISLDDFKAVYKIKKRKQVEKELQPNFGK